MPLIYSISQCTALLICEECKNSLRICGLKNTVADWEVFSKSKNGKLICGNFEIVKIHRTYFTYCPKCKSKGVDNDPQNP